MRILDGEIADDLCNIVKCISIKDCKAFRNRVLNDSYLPKVEKYFDNIRPINHPLQKLDDYFIPRIEVRTRKSLKNQIKIVNKCKINTISVSLQDLLSPNNPRSIKSNFAQDLHHLFDFHKKIILSLNIRDKLCKFLLEHLEIIPKIFKILNPDITTTLDANFYIDQPFFITALQLNKILKGNIIIERLKIQKIGLVPPSMSPFFEITLLSILKRNYSVVAIPLLEINKYSRVIHNIFREGLMKQIYKIQSKLKFKFLLISTNPSKKLYPDYFSGLSWWIPSKNNQKRILHKSQQKLEKYSTKNKTKLIRLNRLDISEVQLNCCIRDAKNSCSQKKMWEYVR